MTGLIETVDHADIREIRTLRRDEKQQDDRRKR